MQSQDTRHTHTHTHTHTPTHTQTHTPITTLDHACTNTHTSREASIIYTHK